jgi:hypothetical protein
MNKLLLLLLPLALLSCNKPSEENPNNHFWGKRKFYTDFPLNLKNYNVSDTTHTFRKTLRFEFNQVAKDSIAEAVEFQLVERIVELGKDGLPKDTTYLPVLEKEISLFSNGVKCENNVLKINTNDEIVPLEIAFTKDTGKEDHKYTLCLRVINNGGLDRIGNIDVSDAKNVVLADEWVLEKDYVYNPLAKGLFWTFVVIVVVLTVCFIISRIANPTVKFSKLYIDYDDGAGEQRIDMGSAYKLLCTNKKTKFSVFSKFFVGVVKVEVNDFWTHAVTIKSGTRNNVRVSGLGEFEMDTDETVRKEPFTITNDNGQKVIIVTA